MSSEAGEPAQPPMSEAALRAQKRQARIRANAGERISKVTSNSRESEGASYLKKDTPFDEKPVTGSTTASAPAAAPSSGSGATSTPSDDPADVDLALLSSDDDQPRNAMGGQGPHGEPDLMSMLSQLSGQQQQQGGAGQQQEDPMAQMMAALQNMQSGQMPQPPQGQHQHQVGRPKSLLERCLPLLHLLSMCALATYIYASASALGFDWATLVKGTQAGDPTRNAESWSFEKRSLPHVPVLVSFITVEVVLQSIRAILPNNTAPPSGLLGSVLPFIPPPFGLYIRAGFKYWTFVGQLLDDFAVLLFALGSFSLWHALFPSEADSEVPL